MKTEGNVQPEQIQWLINTEEEDKSLKFLQDKFTIA